MKRRRLRLSVQIMRVLFRAVAAVWPGLAAAQVYRIWFKSPRYPESKREKMWREAASNPIYPIAGQAISVYQWGECTSGYVLLIHGWSGRGTQLAGFVDALRKVGLGVLSFDAPGHGRSEGTSTNIYQFANVVNELAKEYGVPTAIVSHSFGGMVAALAIQRYQLMVDKLVMISCPMDTHYLIAGYQRYLDFNDRVMKLFETKIFSNLSQTFYDDTLVEVNLKKHPLATFIIHDKEDRIVSYQQSEKISVALPDAKVLFTNGLGHARILRDKTVIKQVVEFIKIEIT